MKKIGRKEFLKIGAGAAAGGLAGYIFSGAPFKGLQWLVEKTQDQLVPKSGKESYLKTICYACKGNCEMSIRMIGDRAVKIETSNSGCPLGQSTLQLLYHPERIDSPLKRTGSKGTADVSAFEKVTWETALEDIALKMKTAIDGNKAHMIAGINKSENLSSALLERIINSAGSPHVYYEPTYGSLTKESLGGYIDYDFFETDFILSFGSRLLEGWGIPSAMNKAFLEWTRKEVKIVQADSVCTRTASMTEWLNIKPGTELFLAMGIANYLLKNKGKSTGNDEFDAIIENYSIDKAVHITGTEAKRIEEVADAFSRARKPIAVAGRGGTGVSSSYAEIAVVHALNIMTGTEAVTFKDYSFFEKFPLLKTKTSADNNRFKGQDDFLKNGSFDILFFNEADPVYKSPLSGDLIKKLNKTFVVSIAPLINDTAMYADYILPPLTFIEDDPSDGKTSLKPFNKSKHTGDMIISLAQKIDGIKKNFPWDGYKDAIKKCNLSETRVRINFNPKIINDQLSLFEKTNSLNKEFPLYLVPVELSFIGDGRGLAFPYILKAIDEKSFSNGKLWAGMNRETAREYGISEGKQISIESYRGRITPLKVHLTDIVPPDTIAIPIGFGHKAFTKYAGGKGVNPKQIMTDDIDPLTGAANWWLTKVRIG